MTVKSTCFIVSTFSVGSGPRVASNKVPELIDLCGGTDDVAQLDPDSFELPDQELLMNK